MKIARTLPVSERHIEWYAPIPGSLSEGAVERSETEGVSPDEWKTPFVGAMKIARTPTVSGRHVEWYPPPQPFPAPSLRELSAKLTEGVYFDEWKTPFVGAMKIARTPTVSGRHVEWYPPPQPFPAPSLRELSAKLTEGVYFDERNRSKISEFYMSCE